MKGTRMEIRRQDQWPDVREHEGIAVLAPLECAEGQLALPFSLPGYYRATATEWVLCHAKVGEKFWIRKKGESQFHWGSLVRTWFYDQIIADFKVFSNQGIITVGIMPAMGDDARSTAFGG